jgi:AAA domain
MRIHRVKLKHFRSHQHTVLSFERVSFIRGLNRSGKSGVAMAIEMALAGRCAVTDEGGKGFEELIQEGEQTATVVLECGAATITLTLDRRTGRNFKVETGGRVVLGRQAQDWIVEHVGTSDVINATLNAWRFMELTDNEQASLLARVLLPAKLELEPEVSTWLAHSALAIVQRPSLFGTIEATHKSIAAARTEVNRKLRDLKTLAEPDPVTASRDKIKKTLDEIQLEQSGIIDKLRIRARVEAIAVRAAEQRAAIHTEMENLEVALPVLREELLSKQRRKDVEAKAAARHRQPELHTKINAERVALQTIEAALQHDHEGVCPTCKTPLSAGTRTTLFAPLRANRDHTKAVIAELEQQLAAGQDEQAAVELANDNSQRLKIRDAEAALTHLHEQLEALKVVDSDLPEHPDSTESLQARLVELKADLATQMDALVHVATLEEQHAVYRKQLLSRQHAETQLVELEKLLDYFGPRGIKARLIDERLNLFTSRVNAVLDQWGYHLHFTIEPYRLSIVESDEENGTVGPALNPNQLSASERYRLGIAFAVAIADWTGLRLLIADGADILDKDDKWRLAQILLHSDLEQAIMTSTGIAGSFPAAGTAFYTLSKVSGVTVTETDAITPETQQMVAHG